MSEEKLTNEQLHYYEAWKQQKATVTRLRGLLRRCQVFMEHGPEFPLHLLADAEDLQGELAKELKDG